jgi:hypothetical protein
MPVNYSKGKIYTIRCKYDENLIYVGSTIQSLAKRWGGHKKDSLKYSNRILYQSINDNWDNWYIELYELYSCNSKEELCKREGEVIREIGTLNKRIEGRTQKQYRNENADKISERKKQYRIENIDKISGQNKQYYEENADKLKKYHKEYYIENTDKIKEHSNQYYQENKNKINEKNKQKITCECGCELTKRYSNKHIKTKRHQELMNSLKQD